MSQYEKKRMSRLIYDHSLPEIETRLDLVSGNQCFDFVMDDVNYSSALLRPGEYVMYTSSPFLYDPSKPSVLVGQIIELAELRDIPREEVGHTFWQYHETLEDPDPRELFALVRHLDYKDEALPNPENYPLLPPMLQEVRFNSSMQWIETKRIEAIAFVFQIDQVNLGAFSCAGMRNAFFVRESLDSKLEATALVDKFDFDPFYVPFGGESYSKRIWNSLSSVKELCWRSMTSSKSQWDGRTKHVHFPGVNKELMQYITYMMKSVMDNDSTPLCEDTMTVSKAKKMCHPDLSVSNKKRRYDVSLLRVVEEKELDLVRSVFGSTFGVGLTHSAPTIKAIKEAAKESGKDISTVELQDHQIVRIVTCREDDVDTDVLKDKVPAHGDPFDDDEGDKENMAAPPFDKSHPQKRWISFPGCDFFFEESTYTNFHVALRFKKLKANADTVAKAQNGGVLGRAVAAPICSIKEKDEFRYKERIYSVKVIEDGNVKSKLNWEDSEQSDFDEEQMLVLPVEEVTPLVKEFNQVLG
jgi:hypothetical protein